MRDFFRHILYKARTSYMKSSRKKTRRHLVQKLYSQIYTSINEELFNEAFFDDKFNFDPDTVYLTEMFSLVVEKQHDIL
jgi:hypothetical protein